ncbi:MAG: hypothetical protein WCF96_09540 [Eubacteriales bacterium]
MFNITSFQILSRLLNLVENRKTPFRNEWVLINRQYPDIEGKTGQESVH